MKKYLLLLIVGVALWSCEGRQTPVDNPDPKDTTHTPIDNPDDGSDSSGGANDPEITLGVVKFTDDKYREYIIAEHIEEGSPVTMRGSTPFVVEELIVGTIPYSVKLPNGYWLIDWKWGHSFLYRPSCVLLPYKWETLTHWNQTWDMPDNRIPFQDFIEDCRNIFRRTIDTHLGLNQDIIQAVRDEDHRDASYDAEYSKLYDVPWVFGCHYMSEKDIPEDTRDRYFKCIHQQDSLEDIYTQRLIEIINNGDFEKVCDIEL